MAANRSTELAGFRCTFHWDSSLIRARLSEAAGEFARSASIFRDFARQITGQLIPNRFRGGTVEYNTADASMWYGKTVEMNALWYTHLRWLAGMNSGGAEDFMRVAAGAVAQDFVAFDWAGLADRVQASLDARFRDGDSGRLSDVVDGAPDGQARR